MFRLAFKELHCAIKLFFLLTVLTGLIYPLLVTGIAQLALPIQANGSLIKEGETLIGSRLIGQSFTDPKYFWGRPSATSPYPYNGANSSGSNLGPSNPKFIQAIRKRSLSLQQSELSRKLPVPVELVTASGSGLDPEISPYAAIYQIPRIAKIRHLSTSQVFELIHHRLIRRTFGIIGEPRVNVLELNIALDHLEQQHG